MENTINNLSKNRRNNALIDLFKFIGSIMIFIMHIDAFNDYPNIGLLWQLLTRWAVPFFFITSAYFLFSKEDNQNISLKTLMKYSKRIGLLYLFWLIYNIPSVFAKLYSQGLADINTYLNFIKSLILSSTFIGSWYLLSSIFSATIIFLLSKKIKSSICVIIFLPLQILLCFSSVYSNLIPTEVSSVLLFLSFPLNIFSGLFYFSVGKFIYDNRNTILKLSKKLCFILFWVFLVLYITEVVVLKLVGYYSNSSDVAFFVAPLSICLFLGCLKSEISFKNSMLFRQMSTVIYCGQGNVLIATSLFCKILRCSSSIIKCLVGICLISIVVSVFLFVKRKTNWRFLRYMV